MMENVNMTMTAQQKADRLALIKKVAQKRDSAAAFKKKLAAQGSIVRRWSDVEEKPKRQAKQDAFDKEIASYDSDNINAWTDASKYAKEYYGETLHYTTKFDNDWD
jgi:hypothetical protein